MNLWHVNMHYATSVSVEVNATTYEEAVERAKREVDDYKSEYFDLNDVDFEALLNVRKIGGKHAL